MWLWLSGTYHPESEPRRFLYPSSKFCVKETHFRVSLWITFLSHYRCDWVPSLPVYRIYLPDPVAFFDLLHPQAVDSSLRSSKAFFSSSTGKKSAATKNVEGRTILQQAALGLLQWAQNGESFVFSSPSASLSSSHDDEKGDENDDSDENDDMMMVVDDRDEVMGEEGGNKDGANDDNDGLMSVQQTRLDEMDAPIEFKATLRPYQRQALWWMTQREAQEELEESSKQQLQLLEELVQANSPTMSNSPISSAGSAPPIHCECGPVQVDVTQISAPAFDDLDSNPEMKHPLWERRFLTNSTKTVARSFYVQPLFGCAMAIPPEPPRACRGGILADSMGLVRPSACFSHVQDTGLLYQHKGELLSYEALTYFFQFPLVFHRERLSCYWH